MGAAILSSSIPFYFLLQREKGVDLLFRSYSRYMPEKAASNRRPPLHLFSFYKR